MAFLSQIEREYFTRKVGSANVTAQTPLNDIRRIYYSAQLGNVTTQTPFAEIETRWQIKVIRDAGKTPSNENSNATLWREMVVAKGGTPVHSVAGNKIKFYLLDV